MKILTNKQYQALAVAFHNLKQENRMLKIENRLLKSKTSYITNDLIFPNTDERGLTGDPEMPDEENISDIFEM